MSAQALIVELGKEYLMIFYKEKQHFNFVPINVIIHLTTHTLNGFTVCHDCVNENMNV